MSWESRFEAALLASQHQADTRRNSEFTGNVCSLRREQQGGPEKPRRRPPYSGRGCCSLSSRAFLQVSRKKSLWATTCTERLQAAPLPPPPLQRGIRRLGWVMRLPLRHLLDPSRLHPSRRVSKGRAAPRENPKRRRLALGVSSSNTRQSG